MSDSTHNPSPDKAPPSPLGMLSLGLTATLFGLFNTGLSPIGAQILGVGLLYGGSCLVLVGIADWRQRHPLGAVIGIAFGLFWLSLLGMILLPACGIGKTPGPAAIGSFLAMWGLFTAVLFSSGHQGGRRLQTALGLLMVSLLLGALGEIGGNSLIRAASGWVAIAAGLVVGYSGLLRLSRESGRTAPLPPRSVGAP